MAWYRKAADQGDWRASNGIAALYTNGWGVKQDLAKAIEWNQRAMDQSSKDIKKMDEDAKAAIRRIKGY